MSGSRGEANFVWKCKNCKVNYLPNFSEIFLANSQTSARVDKLDQDVAQVIRTGRACEGSVHH